ncbi:NmrA family NAD(P)-binding protein [Rufibacter sediminis]|uniref:NmrA family NAD(P)-binding protein n=1 Tax=Rufibacter sediminis TaxID=2762756 RepID=A0ABR6VPE8_9BACT|nr:NmrA family NAD(P)-binding protein [Rufibacter sediminis]MBC3539058.1 NmrA family NAD(P)-binding protein [Rufibacter sediminis]
MAPEQNASLEKPTIIVAGATGDLGGRIVRALVQRGAHVRAMVRPGTAAEKSTGLRNLGASVVEVDFQNAAALREVCAGGTCVISALSGLREVIVDAQTLLLQAAVEAGVPRFIPSDFSIDFTKLPQGTNRNLDLRREFAERLNQAPIAATSVLNGMFTDLLVGAAPVVLFPMKRVVYWGNAHQPLDFTTIEDTAHFTAAAALDAAAPRYLRIAGEVVSASGLKDIASEVTGKNFRLLRAGSLGRLDTLIKVTRALFPQPKEVFPPWQGMQYLRNMFSGLPKLQPLDNARYPDLRWASVKEVLSRRGAQS